MRHTMLCSRLSGLFIDPKFILLAIASSNVLAVPGRYTGCPYNWWDELGFAFTLFVSALALWTSQWWSNACAVYLSGSMVLGFIYNLLKIHRLIPLDSEEMEMLLTPAEWWEIMLWRRPEELLQVALAGIILCCALLECRRRPSLKKQPTFR